MKILIAGAGPTGLTGAIELYRRGFKPCLIDKKDGPSPLARAVGINARSLELLEASGATEALLNEGIKIQKLHIHENDKEIGTINFTNLPHRYNFLLALPQDHTEKVLTGVLESLGGTIEFGRKLTGLEIKDGKAHVRINEGEEVVYDLVIGADGVRSIVRQAAVIPFEGFDYQARWSIADFESQNWDKDAALYFYDSGHIRFFVRIAPHRFRGVADEPETLTRKPGELHIDALHRADDFVISVRQAPIYQNECVYLAGDAAHVHSPAGGRGMNLGIEDACDLARRVAEGGLEHYTKARYPCGRAAIHLSQRLVKFATLQSTLGKWARRKIIGLTSRSSFLQKPLLRRISGLS